MSGMPGLSSPRSRPAAVQAPLVGHPRTLGLQGLHLASCGFGSLCQAAPPDGSLSGLEVEVRWLGIPLHTNVQIVSPGLRTLPDQPLA